MPLARPRFVVYLNPDPESTDPDRDPPPLEVTITTGDQLRAELEAIKQGLPAMKDAPINHTVVWVWCALVRTGAYVGDFRAFKLEHLAGIEAVREADDDEVPAVDPTPPAVFTGSP